jgi:hypothetical protein
MSQAGIPVVDEKTSDAPKADCCEGSTEREEDCTKYEADVDTAAAAGGAASCATPMSFNLRSFE